MPELFSDKEENYLNYAKDFQNKHLDRFILQRNVKNIYTTDGKKSFKDFLTNLSLHNLGNFTL